MSIDTTHAPGFPARHLAVTALSDALTKLTNRLRSRAEAARDFEALTSRAKSIAALARDVQTSRWGVVEMSEKLAADLAEFAQDVNAAADRATSEVERNAALVDAMADQTERVAALGRTRDDNGTDDGFRDEIKGLQATLQTLHARVWNGSAASTDASALARRAGDLAGCAGHLRGGRREADEAAATIVRSLNSFADTANSIAERMSTAATARPDAGVRIPFGAIEPKPQPADPGRKTGPLSGIGWR